MAKINTKNHATVARTHEGAIVKSHTAEQELRRAVASCLLWEDTFYESGEDIATRIFNLCGKVDRDVVANLAVEARHTFKLRHVPLLLLTGLAKFHAGVEGNKDVVAQVISRPDELTELAAIYWKGGRKHLPNSFIRGMAKAFDKFDEYQLAKYNRDGAVKLRDILFLSHPKAKNEDQQAIFDRLATNTLATPETWEVKLSAGENKKDVFENLIRENKLGYLALLRNLRNMEEAGCDRNLVKEAILARRGADRVLPFRYYSAAKHAPSFEKELDTALIASLKDNIVFEGETIVLVDTSGSMTSFGISKKSELMPFEIAAILSSMIGGDVRLFHFATNVAELPKRMGMAGVDTVRNAVGAVGHGTDMGKAVNHVLTYNPKRIIILSDMQTMTQLPNFAGKGYCVNVASYQNSVAHGDWTQINGFSENTLRFIREYENL